MLNSEGELDHEAIAAAELFTSEQSFDDDLEFEGHGHLGPQSLSATTRDDDVAERHKRGKKSLSATKVSLKGAERLNGPSNPNPNFMRIRTAVEIAKENPPEPPWVCKPWVAEGGLTEVVGKPKTAGKTTWILAMIRAVLEGKDFMGGRTVPTPVLYLTEERSGTLKEALGRAGLLKAKDFHCLQWGDTMGVTWPEVTEFATKEALRLGCKLVVVDTISHWAALKADEENTSGAAIDSIKQLQKMAAQGIAVIVVRHERKSGGGIGDSGRGSGAWTGAVDVVVALQRPAGNARATVREVHALGRFSETPEKTIIERMEDGTYVIQQSAALAIADAEQALLFNCPTNEDEAMPFTELHMLANIGRGTAQKALDKLVAANKVIKLGKGVSGNPYRIYKKVRKRNKKVDPISPESVRKMLATKKD